MVTIGKQHLLLLRLDNGVEFVMNLDLREARLFLENNLIPHMREMTIPQLPRKMYDFYF